MQKDEDGFISAAPGEKILTSLTLCRVTDRDALYVPAKPGAPEPPKDTTPGIPCFRFSWTDFPSYANRISDGPH